MSGTPLKIGPKSAAWLRQVGVRTREDLASAGAVAAFVRVKRAGFKPSLSLLYVLEGLLTDQHWQQIPESRREALRSESESAIAALATTAGQAARQPGQVVSWSQPETSADVERSGNEQD